MPAYCWLQLQLRDVDVQFGLAHLVGGAGTYAVQVAFVAQHHALAVKLHLAHLDLVGHVVQGDLVVDAQLLQLVLLGLLLVQQLLVFGLCALQVQLQDGGTHVHAVAPFLIDLDDAGVDGRIDNLFERRHHLARSADADLDGR